MLRKGKITFERDNGTITLDCKINVKTLEVSGFDMALVFSGMKKLLSHEFISFDGLTCDVYGLSDSSRTEFDFWYDDIN